MATDLSIDPALALEAILPKVELIAEDGENLETGWHVHNIHLLIESVHTHFGDRQDFYAGGNQFIYFNVEQARNRDFRGPDFYVVLDTHRQPLRDYWCVWEEGGKYPNVIVELLSPSTAREDRTTKKDVYEQVFRTPNFYCYDPFTRTLDGWQLHAGSSKYDPLPRNERGWLWCAQLQLWLGTWEGEYAGAHETWLRFYYPDGRLVPNVGEAAQQREAEAKQHAGRAKQREAEAKQRATDAQQREAEAKQQAAEAKQHAADAQQREAETKQRLASVEAELAQLKAQLAAREPNSGPK